MANRFRRMRNDHELESASDYCELVDLLIRESGEARAVELAKRLGISQVSVSKTVRRLVREGFLVAEPYRSIFLTESGKLLAAQSRDRHDLVVRFLESIGVPAEIAEQDAEGIEHHVSEETLDAIRRALEKAGGR